MDGEAQRSALFTLEGPNEDGSVWIASTAASGWRHNLGPAAKAAEVLTLWLASYVPLTTVQLTQDE